MSPHSRADNISSAIGNKDSSSIEDEQRELQKIHSGKAEDAQNVMLKGTIGLSAAKRDDEANHLPIGPRLMLIVASLMLSVFCMALDNNVRWLLETVES